MKFITEMELRDLYRTEPFTTFVLGPDVRVTPGARQFLADRRVTLVQGVCSEGEKSNSTESHPVQSKDSLCTLKLARKMESMESLFLLMAAEILRSGDAVQAEEIMTLGKCFRDIRKAEQENGTLKAIQFRGWSEEEIEKRSDDIENCVNIGEFHVGLEHGKEIVLLNYLRASLGEVEPAILEIYWDEVKQVCLRQDLIDRINLIMKIISIIIRKCLGG